ncbi:MAG: VTT domain-containing protein [Patescibacteria group bacterium]
MKGKDWFLIISLLLILAYGLIYFLFPEFQNNIDGFNARLESFARAHGYLGAFVISLVGSASLFIMVPYVGFVFLLATAGLNIWWLSLLSGFGAALGEIISYLLGYAGGRLTDKHHREKYEKIHAWIRSHPRLTPLFIFIFGLTPLPDDLIFIPLGLVRYNFIKAFIPGFLGKAIMIAATLYLGKTGLNSLGLENGNFYNEIITLVSTILIIYGVLKINWEKLLENKNA